jgi:hypothetical protein
MMRYRDKKVVGVFVLRFACALLTSKVRVVLYSSPALSARKFPQSLGEEKQTIFSMVLPILISRSCKAPHPHDV